MASLYLGFLKKTHKLQSYADFLGNVTLVRLKHAKDWGVAGVALYESSKYRLSVVLIKLAFYTICERLVI